MLNMGLSTTTSTGRLQCTSFLSIHLQVSKFIFAHLYGTTTIVVLISLLAPLILYTSLKCTYIRNLAETQDFIVVMVHTEQHSSYIRSQ